MTADDPNDISDESLDGLVEGTLDDDRRRALLLALEADPEGWRRCALAFLENQAWSQALAPLADHPASRLPHVSSTRRATTRSPLRLALRCGLAASLLATAFGAGLLTNRNSSPERPSIVSSIPNPTPQPPVVSQVPNPAPIEVAEDTPNDEDSGGMDAIPGHVRRQLASQGYKVEQRRMLVDVPLEDGRSVAVPFDQVSFQFVGNQAL